MRIVHVVDSGRTSTPGLERHAVNLAVAQKARGSDVKIITDQSGVFTEICYRHDIPVVIVESLAVTGPLPISADREGAEQDLLDHFSTPGTDLIHCHTPSAAHKAVPAGNLLNIPCVVHSVGPAPVIVAKRLGLRFVTICVTRSSFEALKAKGVPEAELYYIASGTPAFSYEPRQGRSPSAQANLMMVGSLVIRKGVDIAILAMAELRRRHGQGCPALNIYGDGTEEGYFREMAALLDLGDIVRFHGFQPDILEHCPATDILVMASRFEIGPLVVLEAMSHGMPIVATSVGEVTEMLPDQRYGRIVPQNSIVALADAIDSLRLNIAAGQFSPAPLVERHRSLYTVEQMAERVEAVYRQMLLKDSPGGKPGPSGPAGR